MNLKHYCDINPIFWIGFLFFKSANENFDMLIAQNGDEKVGTVSLFLFSFFFWKAKTKKKHFCWLICKRLHKGLDCCSFWKLPHIELIHWQKQFPFLFTFSSLDIFSELKTGLSDGCNDQKWKNLITDHCLVHLFYCCCSSCHPLFVVVMFADQWWYWYRCHWL